MKRKGLAVIYDPNSLRQFIWYYATVSKDTEWDALCFPYGGNNIRMEKYCEKTDIFNTIYSGENDYFNLPLFAKLKLFMWLLVNYVKANQNGAAKSVLNQFVDDIERYDIYISNTDTGFISGLLARFAMIKDVIYLEDGSFDYRERSKYKCTFKTFSFEYWQGLMMSRMGYCSKGRFYFEPTLNCIKYCTAKNKMRYTNYREMLDINFKNTDMEVYDCIIKKIYPDISQYDFQSADMVVFTDPISDFTHEADKYRKITEEYIKNNAKNILLKKHPRDVYEYDFGSVKCIEVDNTIPAELLLPYVMGKKLLFFMACSIMLSISEDDYDSKVLYYDQIAENKGSGETWSYYTSEAELLRDLRDVNCENIDIVHI